MNFAVSGSGMRFFSMSKAAQEFSSETYLLYVEDGNSRRTQLIGKRPFLSWKQTTKAEPVDSAFAV
jgi:hypothetical protein